MSILRRKQPSILTNRFILNLRQLSNTANRSLNSDDEHFSRFSAPNFHVTQTIPGWLGSAGEPLEHGQPDGLADDEGNGIPNDDAEGVDEINGDLNEHAGNLAGSATAYLDGQSVEVSGSGSRTRSGFPVSFCVPLW